MHAHKKGCAPGKSAAHKPYSDKDYTAGAGHTEAFRAAIAAAGIEPPDLIEGDGRLHRFHVAGDKRGSLNGWYLLYLDGRPAGAFGSWKLGGSHTWSAAGRPLSGAERAAFAEVVQAAKREAEAERRAEHEAKAEMAREAWAAAGPADPAHPYLVAKGVKPHSLRQRDDLLLVPLFDALGGTLRNLQRIWPDGEKKFMPGRAGGLFSPLGDFARPDEILICEGWATGATLYETTGHPVLCAMNRGSLLPVAKAARESWPGAELVICADNDRHTEGNPGVTDATAAAKATGAGLAVPPFAEDEQGSDFNDLAALHGAETVARCIDAAAPNELEAAREIVAQAIEAAKDDPTAHLRSEVMDAFRRVREHDPLEYEAARTGMKRANSLVRMEALDKFTDSGEEGERGQESVATMLAELVADLCELWHDPDGNAFASFDHTHDGGTHREHWRVDSSGFVEWLAWLAHTKLGLAPPTDSIKTACNAISGKAKFDGQEYAPALRVAKDESGYWLDMCDDRWRAILITPAGWKIVDTPPVRFVRNKAMRPLTVPQASGDVSELWPLVNVPEEDRPLVLAWLLESLRPDTPYPVLELIGEQGSAKSTTQETLRRLLDPNKVMLRGRPKGVEDVFVAAGANHIISLENLSGISPELSDALCTISTGGGQAGRQLFTNGEEHIIEAHNPIMLNGIGAVVTRPDLLDRAIAVCLPIIGKRITEAEHGEAFERHAPSVMAGLLDLFARTLAGMGSVHIEPADRPRMADFAQLGEAMHRAMGGKPGEWLALYGRHRRDAIRRTIDSSPVAQACIAFVEDGGRHVGTVKRLLETLNARNAANNIERGDYWPRSPKGLGDALRRAAPALRQIGIHLSIETKPRRDGVHCELRAAEGVPFPAGVNIEEPSSPSSQPSHARHEREGVKL